MGNKRRVIGACCRAGNKRRPMGACKRGCTVLAAEQATNDKRGATSHKVVTLCTRGQVTVSDTPLSHTQGQYGLRVTGRDAAGEVLMCLNVDFELVLPSNAQEHMQQLSSS